MSRTLLFILRQVVLVGLASLGYFGVRRLTEGDSSVADRNANQILRLERALGLDIERGLQSLLIDNHLVVTAANWVYVWVHWPVIVGTLVYLAARHRDHYLEFRNTIFISGAIGLVIFATYSVSPPRLFADHYIDTVAQQSVVYEVLQPPSLVNKYAAVPSFHFGWNLLVALTWYRVGQSTGRERLARVVAIAMPAAMAFAVVATANHWILDVIAGGTVTLAALAVERRRPHRLDRWLRRALVDGLFEPRRNPTIDLEPVVEDRALHSRQQHR